MDADLHTWAVILAGGEGLRLRSLTRDSNGHTTPKQYCSLLGASTLVQDALRRGQSLVDERRLCAVVADSHARWWRPALSALARDNIICQPSNRGTGIGVLLSVLWILQQDPLARLLFLPADHFVEEEQRFCSAVSAAIDELRGTSEDIVLLGIEPRESDTELGYILCGNRVGGSRRVVRFIEKPSLPLAQELLSRGALWNTFIFAANGAALLSHFRRQMPLVVDKMETAVARATINSPDQAALFDLYRNLPEMDFSREILTAIPMSSRAVTSPDCGWSDLGTPRRVAEALRRAGVAGSDSAPKRTMGDDRVCLAAMVGRLQPSIHTMRDMAPD